MILLFNEEILLGSYVVNKLEEKKSLPRSRDVLNRGNLKQVRRDVL